MTRKIRLLVVDDQPDAVDITREVLEDCGYAVMSATSGAQARQLIEEHFFDLLILDERMHDTTGSNVLAEAQARYPDIGAIFITGYGDLDTAVKAMHLGALDFLQKPVHRDNLAASVSRALKLSELTRENRLLRHDAQTQATFANIIGQGPAIKATLDIVRQVIPTHATVLLQGESGTGKELFARAIHFNGPRKAQPFISVNSAAIPASLIESVLFGHKKGAFTDAKENRQGYFEAADRGTIFLDEIGDLAPEAQSKLLRVLQEEAIVRLGEVTEIPVNVRVIAATNKDLKAEVEAGRFRADLFYRLAVIVITLPPLRVRGEDLALLAVHLLEKNIIKLGKPIKRIMPDALEKLAHYNWPGNVRELNNVIQRAITLAPGDTITPDLLLLETAAAPAADLPDLAGLTFKEALLQFETKYFSDLLRHAEGNKTRAAAKAGISRTVLYEHLEKVGLSDPKA